jgi:hypothetical protein
LSKLRSKETLHFEDLVRPERLKSLQEFVTDHVRRYLRPDGQSFDPERIKTIKNGCDTLQRGQERPADFYCSKEGLWGYWYCRFVRNAYQATYILRKHAWECRHDHLNIVQLGGGPAEDLIGILEHLSLLSGPKSKVTYVSIDTGCWDSFLKEVRTNFLPTLFPELDVSLLDQCTINIQTEGLGRHIPSLPHQAELLVVVANTLVASKGEDELSTQNIVDAYADLVNSLAPPIHSFMIVEPSGMEDKVEDCLSEVAKLHSIDDMNAISSGRFRMTYRPILSDVQEVVFPNSNPTIKSRRCYGLLRYPFSDRFGPSPGLSR